MLPKRAIELIEQLGLVPHPEGGFYKETYRSEKQFSENRQLLTSIYFLLVNDNCSHFHRIQSDEAWYYHEGTPLVVHTLDNENGHVETLLGTNLTAGETPFFMVPGNTIFGSSVQNNIGYTLVSCAVAPGFEFSEFELFNRSELLAEFPEHKEIVTRLTSDSPSF